MPAGVQVFDGVGNVILEVTDTAGKYLGEISIPANATPQSGSVSNSGLTTGTVWWLSTLPPTNAYADKLDVSINTSTGVLSWTVYNNNPAISIYYGVY